MADAVLIIKYLLIFVSVGQRPMKCTPWVQVQCAKIQIDQTERLLGIFLSFACIPRPFLQMIRFDSRSNLNLNLNPTPTVAARTLTEVCSLYCITCKPHLSSSTFNDHRVVAALSPTYLATKSSSRHWRRFACRYFRDRQPYRRVPILASSSYRGDTLPGGTSWI
jgi:hypothetical protein